MDSPFKDGVFTLEGDGPLPTGDADRPRELLPYLDRKGWSQYSDEAVYQFDRRIREFFKGRESDRSWTRIGNNRERRYCYKEIYEAVMGVPYRLDVALTKKIVPLLAYYSNSIYKNHKMRDGSGWRTKSSYQFLRHPTAKPPYSLRLRFEWLAERGMLPNAENMACPKRDLKPGHSRNEMTNKRMEERSERAKERYYDDQVRQAKRRAADTGEDE